MCGEETYAGCHYQPDDKQIELIFSLCLPSFFFFFFDSFSPSDFFPLKEIFRPHTFFLFFFIFYFLSDIHIY